MGLDLDEIYYTETMVKILREQGHSQLAMELAEAILTTKGENPKVRALLDEMKEDARRAFERFKNSGRPQEKDQVEAELTERGGEASAPIESEESAAISEAADELQPTETFDLPEEQPKEAVRLTLVSPSSSISREEKIERLQQLLTRVQTRRVSA